MQEDMEIECYFLPSGEFYFMKEGEVLKFIDHSWDSGMEEILTIFNTYEEFDCLAWDKKDNKRAFEYAYQRARRLVVEEL